MKRPTSAGRRMALAGRTLPSEAQLMGGGGKPTPVEDETSRLAQSNTMRARMGLQAEAASTGGGTGVAATTRRGSGDAGRNAAAPAATAASVFKVSTAALPMPLQAIDLTACHRITDRTLAFLGTNAPDLEFIRLRLCDQASLSDAGIVSLAQVSMHKIKAGVCVFRDHKPLFFAGLRKACCVGPPGHGTDHVDVRGSYCTALRVTAATLPRWLCAHRRCCVFCPRRFTLRVNSYRP